jgi:uracil-DNA glycosylase
MNVRDELTFLRELGYTHLDVLDRPTGRVAEHGGGASSSIARPLEDSTSDWDALRAATHDCSKCRLSGSRTNVVFGVGSPNADLMFIGEAPGRDEDLKGEPFVGRAGQLLTDIIKAMKLTRDQVYIANVIKCRPPENRNPEADELDACRPFIRRQIELIQPKVIVTLGRFALQSLTEKGYSISAVRGQWLDYEGIKVMPTYHPAYLLRTPAAKKDVWADMKKVMAELGL